MKLSDLMTILFRNGPITTNNIPDYNISGEYLERYKDDLLKCEEFSEVLDITFVKTPSVQGNIDVTGVKTYLCKDGMKLKGNVVLYSIFLSPKLYDPSIRYETVKDGASVSPTIYVDGDFTPLKYILLSYSPELLQDSNIGAAENLLKQQLHGTLDKVLDNPSDYQMKGHHHILMRGLFVLDSDTNRPNLKVII